jgi:biopolymer transport protein ExbD
MRVPTRPREHGLRFNITPLIDIIFLLIIFFLAASHLARSEVSQEMELPLAMQADDEDKASRHLTIEIPAAGRMHVGGREVELPEVEHMILSGGEQGRDDFEVRIRSDKRVPYSVVEPILLACARGGITKIKFAVLPDAAAPP